MDPLPSDDLAVQRLLASPKLALYQEAFERPAGPWECLDPDTE